MTQNPNKKPIPAWVWIGCGCLLFPTLIALVLAGLGVFAFNFGKDTLERMADPEKRTAAAIEKLGAAALPAGWHVRSYLAMPFGFAMTILGDGTPLPPPKGESFEEKMAGIGGFDLSNMGDNRKMFVYITLAKDAEETMEDLLSGRQRGRSGTQLDLGIRFEMERELSRGDLAVKGHRVAFVGKAGQLETRDAKYQVIYTELSFDCPDKARRLGLLYDVQPAEGEAAGSVADATVLQSFLDHFAVCGKTSG